MISKDKDVKFFFGSSRDYCIDKSSQNVESFFYDLIAKFELKNFTVLKQIHSAVGYCLKNVSKKVDLFSQDGDFLVTQQNRVGVGVLTADCLPVIVVDSKTKTVGIAHAGWRGSAQDIVGEMINKMRFEYNVEPKNIKVWLGPAAKQCCYVVQDDFPKNFEHFSFYRKCFEKRDGAVFFDNGLLNYLLLEQIGVLKQNINISNHVCTICNSKYNSYRRDKTVKRNLSFVFI